VTHKKLLKLFATQETGGKLMDTVMICKVSHQGAALRPAIQLRAHDADENFSPKNKTIMIEMKSEYKTILGYTTLQNDFFGTVRQIRAIYPTKQHFGENLLLNWLEENKIQYQDEIKMEVIVPKKRYRLTKM
jgi:hypothetical protein